MFVVPVSAMTITTQGSLADLNGNGTSVDENIVLQYAVSQWEKSIPSTLIFSLLVSTSDLGGGTGHGGVTGFDLYQFPTAGVLAIGASLPDSSWFVDPTPEQNEEFSQDPTEPWIFWKGPEGNFLDLLSCINHELAHALGMHGDPQNLWFNRRYVNLIVVENGTSYLRLPSGKIPLAGNSDINEYSHLAPVGTNGKGRTLMDSPRVVNNGFAVRTLPDPITLEILGLIHDTVEFPPTPIPEPSTGLLVLVAGLAFTFYRKGK